MHVTLILKSPLPQHRHPEVWEVLDPRGLGGPRPPRCGRWGRVGVQVSNINLVDTMWMGGVAAFRVELSPS